jgi:hypothetical protein
MTIVRARALPWPSIARALWLGLLVLVLALFAAGAPMLWSQVVDCWAGSCLTGPAAVWLAQSRAALGLSAGQIATLFIVLDASTVIGYAATCLRLVATCFCAFPDGRLEPKWTRGIVIVLFLAASMNSLAPGTPLDLYSWNAVVALLFVALIVLAQIHR